jgi:hypothetical protein
LYLQILIPKVKGAGRTNPNKLRAEIGVKLTVLTRVQTLTQNGQSVIYVAVK